MKIRPSGAEFFHADGRTDMKLIVTFRSFETNKCTTLELEDEKHHVHSRHR